GVLLTWQASWNSAGGNSTVYCMLHCSPPLREGGSRRKMGKAKRHASAMNLKESLSRLIWPALKCPPITSVGVSAKRENNSRRATTDCLGSESAVDDQSRCAIWQGWWATSPVSRLSSPSDLT